MKTTVNHLVKGDKVKLSKNGTEIFTYKWFKDDLYIFEEGFGLPTNIIVYKQN